MEVSNGGAKLHQQQFVARSPAWTLDLDSWRLDFSDM
jgi:hypothetical protein